MMNASSTTLHAPRIDELIRRLPHERLTALELHVLLRIARGQTLPGIARVLDTSVETVRLHRLNILARMELPHNAALVGYAASERLIADEND